MITGDNPLTAANIGYQSGILDAETRTLIVDFHPDNGFSREEFNYACEGL
jgi:magnesium-transporting ATPase (P-type)